MNNPHISHITEVIILACIMYNKHSWVNRFSMLSQWQTRFIKRFITLWKNVMKQGFETIQIVCNFSSLSLKGGIFFDRNPSHVAETHKGNNEQLTQHEIFTYMCIYTCNKALDKPYEPIHIPQTSSQRCLSVRSEVSEWSVVLVPGFLLAFHSWRYTCVIYIIGSVL